MTSNYRKNILVGVAAIAALGALGFMIIKFGDAPVWMFRTKQLTVHVITHRADGLGEGSNVTYRGVTVGRVVSITRSDTDRERISVDALVDRKPPLPGQVIAVIRIAGVFGSNGTIALEEANGGGGTLVDGQEIQARYVGQEMIPPEFNELANEMRAAVRQFRESKLVLHLDETVVKAGTAIDSLDKVIGDPKLQEDLKQSLANIRLATEAANRIGTNLEKFSQRLDGMGDQATATMKQAQETIAKTQANVDRITEVAVARLEQATKLIGTLEAIAGKVDQGKGTAGQLINDPRLYESLVDTSRELNLAVKDLKRLVEQWEQEGVTLKLK